MLILGFGAFFVFGCQLVLVGAYQPQLAAALEIGLRETGLLGAAVVSGIGIGVVVAGPIVDRRGGRALFVASVGLTALSLLSVAQDMGFARAAVHLFMAGLGAGLYETVLNAAVVARHGEDAIRRLAFIHSAATLGGMLAPLVILAWIDAGGDFVGGFRLLGGLHAALALWGLRSRAFPPSISEPVDAASPARPPPPMREWITHPAIVALMIAAFFYVGGETSLTLFVIPYSEDILALPADRGRTAISAFWMGLLAMRVLVATVPRPAGVRTLFWSASAGTLLLALGVALRWSGIELLVGGFGLAMGALFPLFVALSGQAVPEARGSAVAIVIGMGAAGGFVLPWVLGVVGDALGSGAVLAGVVVACGLTAAAGGVLTRVMPPATSSESGP